MNTHVTFDYSKALSFIGENELTYLKCDAVKVTHHAIHEKTGAGNDFLGWVDLPLKYDKEEFARIQKCAEKIKNDSDILFGYRYWWLLSRSSCSYRNAKPFFL